MLKKLIYRSHYRGTKEGDLLLSSFAKIKLADCSKDEQITYEKLLEINDYSIHEWLLHPRNAPLEFRDIILKIANFHSNHQK